MIVIGDTVKSKNPKGQVKCEGTVVGLIRADFYVDSMLNQDGKRIPRVDPDIIWSKGDPHWREGLVAIVFFNIAQRSATKAEWVESGVQQGFRKEDCEASYEKQCPIIQYMTFPVSDLVRIDHESISEQAPQSGKKRRQAAK